MQTIPRRWGEPAVVDADPGVAVGHGRDTQDSRPSAGVTHRGRLDDAPRLYQAFDQRPME